LQAYLEVEPTALFYLATDDERFLQQANSWPIHDRIFSRRFFRPASGYQAGCKAGDSTAARQVLLDILLLSRCDFLLSGSSGVSELAIYFNPSLHNHSFNLGFRYGQEGHWLYAAAKANSSAHRRDTDAVVKMRTVRRYPVRASSRAASAMHSTIELAPSTVHVSTPTGLRDGVHEGHLLPGLPQVSQIPEAVKRMVKYTDALTRKKISEVLSVEDVQNNLAREDLRM